MKAKDLMRLLFLIPVLIVLVGCGKKGPPSLPEKPSSLIGIEQRVLSSRCHILGTWSNVS